MKELKNNFLAKLNELKKTFDLCDVWILTGTKSRRFIFMEKDVSGFV